VLESKAHTTKDKEVLHMGKTINLTRVNGCYSKELREMTPAILCMLKEEAVSCEEMKRVVHGIVEFATINAAAKKRFIKNLLGCETKDAIQKLCHDAVIHGMYYHPRTDKASA
jgi:hypothetical protein